MKLKEIKQFAEAVRKKEALEKSGGFEVRLAGVTFEARQEIIRATVSKETALRLVREKSNEYDPYAVAAEGFVSKSLNREDTTGAKIWLQLGYLPRPFNLQIAKELDEGIEYEIKVLEVLGEYPLLSVKTALCRKD